MHSPAFATGPRAAADSRPRSARALFRSTTPSDVLDLDEAAYRRGEVAPRLFGELRSRTATGRIRRARRPRRLRRRSPCSLRPRAASATSRPVGASCWRRGPRSGPWRQLGLPMMLVAWSRGTWQRLGVSSSWRRMRGSWRPRRRGRAGAARGRGPATLVVTAIRGQGFLLRRGNQQLSAGLVRGILASGPEPILVVATEGKLARLQGRPLLVDTGDPPPMRRSPATSPRDHGSRRPHIYRVSPASAFIDQRNHHGRGGRQAGDRHRGGAGIGRATSELLAAEGAAVVLVDLNAEPGRPRREGSASPGPRRVRPLRRQVERRLRAPSWGRRWRSSAVDILQQRRDHPPGRRRGNQGGRVGSRFRRERARDLPGCASTSSGSWPPPAEGRSSTPGRGGASRAALGRAISYCASKGAVVNMTRALAIDHGAAGGSGSTRSTRATSIRACSETRRASSPRTPRRHSSPRPPTGRCGAWASPHGRPRDAVPGHGSIRLGDWHDARGGWRARLTPVTARSDARAAAPTVRWLRGR